MGRLVHSLRPQRKKPLEEEFYHQAGLEFKRNERVSIDCLHYQFRREFQHNPFLMMKNAKLTKSIPSGPLINLLKFYEKYGLEEVRNSLEETDYFQFFKFNEQARRCLNWATGGHEKVKYPRAALEQKVIGFCHLYENLKNLGYLAPPFEARTILILERPYETERFGYELDSEPLEIWSGHHRASCLYALGYSEVRVKVLAFTGKDSAGNLVERRRL